MIPTKAQKDAGVSTLTEMLDRLGFAVAISAKEENQRVVLELKTDDPGRIIGRKGHYLQSMELLLNRILRKKFADSVWMEVEVDGYERKPRHRTPQAGPDIEKLQKIAADAVKEIKRWGQSQVLGPFNSQDRRVVHLALNDYKDIEAESGPDKGGGMKTVAVRLAGKADPEEA